MTGTLLSAPPPNQHRGPMQGLQCVTSMPGCLVAMLQQCRLLLSTDRIYQQWESCAAQIELLPFKRIRVRTASSSSRSQVSHATQGLAALWEAQCTGPTVSAGSSAGNSGLERPTSKKRHEGWRESLKLHTLAALVED